MENEQNILAFWGIDKAGNIVCDSCAKKDSIIIQTISLHTLKVLTDKEVENKFVCVECGCDVKGLGDNDGKKLNKFPHKIKAYKKAFGSVIKAMVVCGIVNKNGKVSTIE